jgi:hypothetical protein
MSGDVIMSDAILRSKLIHLAQEHPEHRSTILPVLKGAASEKIPVNTQDIRKGYYGMTDGFGGLEDAIKENAATKGDKDLLEAVKGVEKAIAALSKALKPYNWD